jgi:hypothetical protein
VRLSGRRFRHHDEGDLPGLQPLHALAPGQNATTWWKDARDANEVTGGNAGGTQRQLEGRQFFAMLANTFREEQFFRNEVEHSR